jgi:hypothetical protein
MLLVFVLAGIIAIALYKEIPRVAFEKQRDREQLLVDRGGQYARSIQIFYRKFGRYPTKMEDLESTNNIRFLRHKYKDPMTERTTGASSTWGPAECSPILWCRSCLIPMLRKTSSRAMEAIRRRTPSPTARKAVQGSRSSRPRD